MENSEYIDNREIVIEGDISDYVVGVEQDLNIYRDLAYSMGDDYSFPMPSYERNRVIITLENVSLSIDEIPESSKDNLGLPREPRYRYVIRPM